MLLFPSNIDFVPTSSRISFAVVLSPKYIHDWETDFVSFLISVMFVQFCGVYNCILLFVQMNTGNWSRMNQMFCLNLLIYFYFSRH